MMVWIAVAIALLTLVVIASIFAQRKISLKLLCTLQSWEERVRSEHRFTRRIANRPSQGAKATRAITQLTRLDRNRASCHESGKAPLRTGTATRA
jgi:hypothetical protein